MKKHFGCLAIALLVGFLGLLAATSVSWDGGVHRNVHVHVTHNGQPVEGATVMLLAHNDKWLIEHLSPEEFQEMLKAGKSLVTTDAKGNAVVSTLFGAGGGSFLFFRHGHFVVGDASVRVTHPSFSESEASLESLLGESSFPLRKKTLKVHFAIP